MAHTLKNARILITGGSGFIGSHLVRRCIREGAQVTTLIAKGDSCWRLDDIKSSFKIFSGSITEKNTLQDIVKKLHPQFVFHLAAYTDRDRSFDNFSKLYAVNVRGTQFLVNSLIHNTDLKCFIHVGTGEEYGRGQIPFRENQREAPISPYSLTKLMATRIVEYIFSQKKIPAIVARPSLVYGPAQNYSMFVPSLIRSCIEGRDFFMTMGEQTRDLLFVDDLLEGMILAVRAGITGEIINFGSRKEIPIKKIANAINAAMENPVKINFGAIPYRDNEQMRYCLDINKARTLLGWRPKITLEKGLDKTINWYRKNWQNALSG